MSRTGAADMAGKADAPRARTDEVRRGKTAVERYRKWFHGLLWPAFFLTVFSTEPSINSPYVDRLVTVLSYAFVTAGTVGRLWCGLYLFGRKSKEFCQDGPYSICRNPLYLSAFLSFAGLALASERAILMIVFPVLFGAYYFAVIKAEEQRLSLFFGADFESYRASVPRIFPRLASYRTRATVVLDPDHYVRGIVKAMGYFWLLFLLRLLEAT